MSPEQLSTSPESTHESNVIKETIDRAWISYAKGNYAMSEAEFDQAFSVDSQSVEASYGLALSLKMLGQTHNALQTFTRTLSLLKDNPREGDSNRTTMLRRIVEAHINLLNAGKPT